MSDRNGRQSLAGVVGLCALAAAVFWPEAAWAPTAVEYLVGPVSLTRGQSAQMKCQNNFAPRGVRVRLTFVDPGDPSGALAGGKVVDVPFRATVGLDLDVDELLPDLEPGRRQDLVGVVELIAPHGLMEEEGVLPGATLQVFDNATGRTGVVVIAIRSRVRGAA
jgi:hypothetical protein